MKRHFVVACLLVLSVTPAAAAPFSPGGAEAINRALGSCGDPCTIHQNNGGRIVDYWYAGNAIRQGGRKELVIDGFCASACMVLADRARPRACITSRAVFAYHKTNFNRPIPLSADLRSWINHRGGFPEFGATPGIMPNEVARHFWPQCHSRNG